MSDDLEYKGYKGSVEFSSEDNLLMGKVLFIDSLIMYDGESVTELRANFQQAVDGYLEHCQRNGKSPNKPYSGTFNVRVGPEKHRELAQLAYRRTASINEILCQAVDAYLRSEGAPLVVNNHTHQHETIVRVVHQEQTLFADVNENEAIPWKTRVVRVAGQKQRVVN